MIAATSELAQHHPWLGMLIVPIMVCLTVGGSGAAAYFATRNDKGE